MKKIGYIGFLFILTSCTVSQPGPSSTLHATDTPIPATATFTLTLEPTTTPISRAEIQSPIVAVRQCPSNMCDVVFKAYQGSYLNAIAHNGDPRDPWLQVENDGVVAWVKLGNNFRIHDDLWDSLNTIDFSVPTATSTPVPPTETPEGYIPQIFIGLERGALWVNSCGDTFTYISQDHDRGASGYETFWDHYGITKPPGYQVRSKDGRRLLDVCTKFGYGIWWAMGDGKVVEKKSGVISIQIISGEAQGNVVTIQHAKSQVSLNSIVKFGDPIGTVDVLPKKPNSPAVVTAIGVLKNNEYAHQQELMLIGIDGFPNLVYAEYFDGKPDLTTIQAVHLEQQLPVNIKE